MEQNFEDLHKIKEYTEYTRSYDEKYIAEIQHLGLGVFRLLKDLNKKILDIKVEEQFRKWDKQWGRNISRNKLQADKEASLNIAKERTTNAQKEQQDIDKVLLFTLEIDDTIDWKTLKDKKKYKTPNPKIKLESELDKIKIPQKPNFKEIPNEPLKSNFQPQLSIFDKLIRPLGQKKIDQSNNQFDSVKTQWQIEKDKIEKENIGAQKSYEDSIKSTEKQKTEIAFKYDRLEQKWNENKAHYYKTQELNNLKVEELKTLYTKHNPESVIQYCELVLNNSQYSDFIPKDFDLDYNKESKLLLVEYVLPSPELFPTLLEVKYIATKKELREVHLTASKVASKYDTLIYNITLRTLHELFEADQANAIELIVFNGWVKSINKATGKMENSCIVSIQAKKEEFNEINLALVASKACFRNLKGIGSSKLSGIVAIQPILQINKDDKRFIASYDVTNTLNEGFNLAAMDWEDFEHLIREVFEKEFSSNGGEVKVTKASRDGGVDAIAFDPDPIRGGKIVIQAKRYTNTVGVSAVRDLYGTVMNEGATKGILVTTANFGPDAYEFVKSKPLTLINGANLLYLLEKYGHTAKIDIAEARRLQKENQ